LVQSLNLISSRKFRKVRLHQKRWFRAPQRLTVIGCIFEKFELLTNTGGSPNRVPIQQKGRMQASRLLPHTPRAPDVMEFCWPIERAWAIPRFFLFNELSYNASVRMRHRIPLPIATTTNLPTMPTTFRSFSALMLNSSMIRLAKRTSLGLLTVWLTIPTLCAQSNKQGSVPLSKWEAAARSGSDRADFRDASGRTSGSATRSGDRITFRDASGRVSGSAIMRGNDLTFRDASGRTIGSSRTNGNASSSTLRGASGTSLGSTRTSNAASTFRDSSGRTVGSSQQQGNRYQFRDASGRSSGSMRIDRDSAKSTNKSASSTSRSSSSSRYSTGSRSSTGSKK